jgi:hypothetical protein
MLNHSLKTRERAESAFAKTQTQFLVRNRITAERDDSTSAQNAKTIRLRALRLAKEAAELANPQTLGKTKRK